MALVKTTHNNYIHNIRCCWTIIRNGTLKQQTNSYFGLEHLVPEFGLVVFHLIIDGLVCHTHDPCRK